MKRGIGHRRFEPVGECGVQHVAQPDLVVDMGEIAVEPAARRRVKDREVGAGRVVVRAYGPVTADCRRDQNCPAVNPERKPDRTGYREPLPLWIFHPLYRLKTGISLERRPLSAA